MSVLRCIIIDDEPIAIEYLKEYVKQMPQLEFVASFNRAADAFDILNSGNVDIMFIDIQMPEITGLDFIRTLIKRPAIIVTTAYSEYAIEGFDLNVTDYLLKPISFERFAQAVLKVTGGVTGAENSIGQQKKDYIFLKKGYKSVKVKYSDISHVEGMKEYVVFYTIDGGKYIKNERMKNVELMLKSYNFIRVHKSYLVSLSYVTSFFGNVVELGDIQIPVGRVYKDEIKRIIEG
ncbi:MAG: LytTR family DNA-binding domain-containing protein [Bacteroidales bacterium]|jgi:DNA-binding LytR/AlgR family response regulator|nr:LytTR family DNA-binding domain-containing protein [Bacteroidales bacterium]